MLTPRSQIVTDEFYLRHPQCSSTVFLLCIGSAALRHQHRHTAPASTGATLRGADGSACPEPVARWRCDCGGLQLGRR